jgi:hypothetical protein
MCGANTYQVSFPGNHGNLGWIEDTESLVHGPLAWMVQQHDTFLHIKFDESELAKIFPCYRSEGADEPTDDTAGTWYNADMRRTHSASLAIMGKRLRKPGRINYANGFTDLKVHIGARLRNHGASEDEDAVPGYVLMAPVTGPPHWALRQVKSRWGSWPRRNNSSRSQSSCSSEGSSLPPPGGLRVGTRSPSAPMAKAATRLDVAPVGALEARCLGMPLSVVTHSS